MLRSNHGGEYFGRMDNGSINHSPFVTYLNHQGIIPQYTTTDTPGQNNVAERKNKTYNESFVVC